MKDILDCCCGLDIHKDTIVACLLKGPVNQQPSSEIRTFSTLNQDIEALRSWVETQDCKHIAMESTGIYWQPVYAILELAFAGDISLIVVNARHMKNVPGKKTDMKDAEWIATLLRAGLLNGSFIPEKDIRDLRQLTRYRKSIISDITSQKNRVEKFLQSSGFRLSTFLSDIFGASGRGIINHLAEYGTITMQDLDRYVKKKARLKMSEIMTAVNGNLNAHQRNILQMLLKYLSQIEKHLTEVETEILSEIRKHEHAIELLDSIPGIDQTAASAIIAEIGIDMSRFKTSEHICSWAGLSPGNNESAGKKKESSPTVEILISKAFSVR